MPAKIVEQVDGAETRAPRAGRGDHGARERMLRRRDARRALKAERSWLREVKGLLALGVAGIGFAALYAFDPLRRFTDQASPVGPVGLWLGWASFASVGYAGFLFPGLLAIYGLGAFFRARWVRGWPGIVGLVVLVLGLTGILARVQDALGPALDPGGLVGWAVAEALAGSVGTVGSWIVLGLSLPVGLLLITRGSIGAMSRSAWTRVASAKPDATAAAPRPSETAAASSPAPAPAREEPAAPPPFVVKEPTKPKSSLIEKGLAWQETFDFGKGGAQAFQLPPVGLLAAPPATERSRTREELEANANTLKRKLQDFGADGHIVQASPGPVITSYEFEPAAGVKVSQVVNLSDDLALAMKAAAVRIVGPIPGRGTVAVEVPNPEQATVYLREILVTTEFVETKGKLPLALGKDTTGNPVVSDLAAMPHLLIAGSTGSGKSVGLNTMICSLLYKATPADVRFLLIDPKRLELGIYEGIPHLLAPVVTDAKEAAMRLKWIVGKMDERYKLLQGKAVRNIEGFNKEVPPEEKLPYWVVVVDELADLMMVSAGEVQNSLVRLAQIARAVGIHLIVATQRPSVDVVTGLIKANFPTRIAFQVASKVDSRTVLDQNGAEALLGRGDMIFVPPGAGRPMRVHGAWVARQRGEGDLRIPPQAGRRGVRAGGAADGGRRGRRR